jgi:hypothetical protein|eukprot:COSAG01_NODE_24020_length_793_cov_1.595101_1_plen_67_part_00
MSDKTKQFVGVAHARVEAVKDIFDGADSEGTGLLKRPQIREMASACEYRCKRLLTPFQSAQRRAGG